jgi:hypothetical protein
LVNHGRILSFKLLKKLFYLFLNISAYILFRWKKPMNQINPDITPSPLNTPINFGHRETAPETTSGPSQTDTVELCSLEDGVGLTTPATITISGSRRRQIELAVLRLLENEHTIPTDFRNSATLIRNAFRQGRTVNTSISIPSATLASHIQAVRNGISTLQTTDQIRTASIRARLVADAEALLRLLDPQPAPQAQPRRAGSDSEPIIRIPRVDVGRVRTAAVTLLDNLELTNPSYETIESIRAIFNPTEAYLPTTDTLLTGYIRYVQEVIDASPATGTTLPRRQAAIALRTLLRGIQNPQPAP